MQVTFNVKRPKGTTKSFSVIPFVRNLDGSKKYLPKINDDGLNTLNRLLKDGEISLAEAVMQFNHTILPRLKKKSDVQDRVQAESLISERNLRVFRKFWSNVYEDKKLAMNGETTLFEFKRALRIIEPLSLITADKKSLQAKLNAACPEGAANKKIGGRINQLLGPEGADRNFKLHTLSPKIPDVVSITYSELLRVLPNIVVYENKTKINKEATEVCRAICLILFGSGCRFGEIFPLHAADLKKDGSIFINKQLKRDGIVGSLKNNKPHRTYLLDLPEVRAAWDLWHSVDKKDYRDTSGPYRAFVRACKVTFKSVDKHINLHDLRHCYVKHLLDKNVPLDKVAKLIGDKLSTCELHYAGWVSSDAEIDYVSKLVRA